MTNVAKALNVLQILREDMADVTISLRIDKKLHQRMKQHDELNWSAVLRRSIAEELDHIEHFDRKRAQDAVKAAKDIRESDGYHGKSGAEIIREWRDKRK
jgi:hypothetical protein